MCDLLYCIALEPDLHYVWGMPVFYRGDNVAYSSVEEIAVNCVESDPSEAAHSLPHFTMLQF